MYTIKTTSRIDKIFLKLCKKNPKQIGIITQKVEEIVKNPYRYKNLRAPLSHLRRVHMDKSFILVFSVDETSKTVILEDYAHHDNIYKTK